MASSALIGALRVTLGLDSAAFEQGMGRAERRAREGNRAFEALSRQMDRLQSAARQGLAALAGGGFVAAGLQYLRVADEAKNLEAQLRLATRASGDFAQAQDDVRRIANETRGGLSETASLYGNFVRATQQMGKTQGDAARATETFSKALKIGGADANAAASATLQFGQALASGALRGDEFNSIAEASPRILKLIADAMGVTQGQVRALAGEGKLTSDVLFKALTDRKFTAGIDTEFRELPVTFDQAMTLVKNAAIETFGAFDEGGQFSTAIADFVGRGADGFAELADAARDEGQRLRASFAGLSDAFEPMRAGASAAFSDIRRDADYAREAIFNMLDGIDQFRNAPRQMLVNALGERIATSRFIGAPKAPVSDFAGRFQRGYTASIERSRGEATSRRLQATLGVGLQRHFADPDKFDIMGQPIGTPRKPPKPPTPGSGGKGKSRGRAGPSLSEKARDALDGLFPNEAKKRELEERMTLLGKALAAKVVNPADYERARAEITRQLAALAPEAQRVIDQMMPEEAKVREIQDRLAEVNRGMAAGLVDPATWAVVRQRLIAELFDAQAAAKAALEKRNAGGGGAIEAPELAAIGELPSAVEEAERAVSARWDGIVAANDNLKESFADTTRDITNSLSGLVDSIRGGDWLSAIAGVADLFGQLAGAGAFGSKSKARVDAGGLPGFATGGSFRVGGRAGVDANLVSMRLTRGEMVDIRRPGQAASGGRPIIFDARGAVMTPDLLAQMNAIATETGGQLISRNNESVAFAQSLRLGGRR